MKTPSTSRRFSAVTCAIVMLLMPHSVQAHCDGLDGPVVRAAQQALASGNVNLVLRWVQSGDEPEIREAFERTQKVRELNESARSLADRYFFETLVRLHRGAEGAAYTGLKPAGRDLGPAIPAADKALATGDLEPLLHLLAESMEHGLRKYFSEAVARKKAADADAVEAGRAFVKAYVEYIHYVEALHLATARAAQGHFAEVEPTARHDQEHAGEK